MKRFSTFSRTTNGYSRVWLSPPTPTIALLATLSLNLAAQTRFEPTVKYQDEKSSKQLYWQCMGTSNAPGHPNFGTAAQFIPPEDDFALNARFSQSEYIDLAQSYRIKDTKDRKKVSAINRLYYPLAPTSALLLAVLTSAMAILSLRRYGPRRLKTDEQYHI